ncbi:MAG: sigma 54-interacting transcriptional regulator, partial [Deltaproteobacteria bacterium]|nr:sigma 54-interacting transcriptional regulator [Deltaproteobacteria bacterium]
ITDKSTNGTFVNDNRIAESRPLKDGDNIAIGDWNIKYEAASGGEAETKVRSACPANILKYEEGKKELISEMIRLEVKAPSGKKKKYEAAKFSIGSEPSNDIAIKTDPSVSGHHCIIKGDGGKFILEDKNSTNGTFLNDKKIATAVLPPKGRLTVGKTKIKFNIVTEKERLCPAKETSFGPLIGASKAMRELFSLIERVSASSATVCLTGESGTGKELVARFIHETSERSRKSFVAVNCGAIPANLIESELFGHEKGSFTSATAVHKGVFEQADKGTLFLDEIGEMPLDLQTRLLRVLETSHIRRVGGREDILVNARIIAATNHDLKNLVKSSKFREDLFYRLYVVPIHLPPLRHRKDDIPLIAEHFLTALAPDDRKKSLSAGAANKLLAYDWPGNVRELKNTIQRSLLLAKSQEIIKEDIVFCEMGSGETEHLALAEQEYKSAMNALKRANGNISEAARVLNVSRTTLAYMIKRFKIDIDSIKVV